MTDSIDVNAEARAEARDVRAGRTERLSIVRLGTLFRIINRSAGIAYGREIGYCKNDWLLISFIGEQSGPVHVNETATRLLLDKAQVSRVMARLAEAGILLRDHDRGPLHLSKKGRSVFTRINRVRHERNQALTKSIPRKDLQILDEVFDKLFAGAHVFLDEERRLASKPILPASKRTSRPRVPDAPSGGRSSPGYVAPLIVPDLQILLRLLGQSAKLAYSRATGLANSDYLTLTHIARNAPLTLTELTLLLDRDKSQVVRSLGRLVSSGHAQISENRGPFSAIVTLKPAGEAAYDAIVAEAHRRDQILLSELSRTERRTFDAVVDRLTENALNLLTDERSSVTP
jgi:DNA-binding MarR family transcriptional regulator